jgi:hypothetical protein
LSQIEKSGETQIAEVDADARLLKKGGGATAGYNVNTAVGAKYKLIVTHKETHKETHKVTHKETHKVTQYTNDEQHFAPMGLAAKAELGVDKMETAQDKGYFNAQQIKTCLENGIPPYVPEPDKLARTRQQGLFTHNDFRYDKEANAYHCPGGQILTYQITLEISGKRIWHYRSSTSVCKKLPIKKTMFVR